MKQSPITRWFTRFWGRLPPGSAHAQRGQSSMEYVVVCAALAMTLFVEVNDKGQTGLEFVLWCLQLAYQKFTYALSLPG